MGSRQCWANSVGHRQKKIPQGLIHKANGPSLVPGAVPLGSLPTRCKNMAKEQALLIEADS